LPRIPRIFTNLNWLCEIRVIRGPSLFSLLVEILPGNQGFFVLLYEDAKKS
jgi:hypothetical protein